MHVKDPTGTYGFTYDNMGRLTGTSTQYAFLAGALTNAYGYDAASNRTGFTDLPGSTNRRPGSPFLPDGSTNTHSYNPSTTPLRAGTLNRLTTLANSRAGSFGFSYDALNRLTQKNYPDSTNVQYTYDLVGCGRSYNAPRAALRLAFEPVHDRKTILRAT